MVAAEHEARRECVRAICRGVRLHIRHRCDVRELSQRERGLRVAVGWAPRPPRGHGQPGDHFPVERPLCADAERDRARVEGVGAPEVVEVACVRDVRRRHERSLGTGHPDLVCRCTLDRRPANQSRMLAVEVARDARPANVEAERRAPRRGAVDRVRAHMRVERVGRAGDPGQGNVDRHGGRLEVRVELLHLLGCGAGHRRGPAGSGGSRRLCELVVRVRPDDRALAERAARRELELVAERAADGQPRERRCAVELVLRRFVGPQQERLQALRRRYGRPVDPRLGAAGERERKQPEQGERKGTSDRKHDGVFIGPWTRKL